MLGHALSIIAPPQVSMSNVLAYREVCIAPKERCGLELPFSRLEQEVHTPRRCFKLNMWKIVAT